MKISCISYDIEYAWSVSQLNKIFNLGANRNLKTDNLGPNIVCMSVWV